MCQRAHAPSSVAPYAFFLTSYAKKRNGDMFFHNYYIIIIKIFLKIAFFLSQDLSKFLS